MRSSSSAKPIISASMPRSRLKAPTIGIEPPQLPVHILGGLPVGYAIQDFNYRYADLSIQVSSIVEDKIYYHKNVPDEKLAVAWVQRNDAEGYIVLGDPAVRLRAGELV